MKPDETHMNMMLADRIEFIKNDEKRKNMTVP